MPLEPEEVDHSLRSTLLRSYSSACLGHIGYFLTSVLVIITFVERYDESIKTFPIVVNIISIVPLAEAFFLAALLSGFSIFLLYSFARVLWWANLANAAVHMEVDGKKPRTLQVYQYAAAEFVRQNKKRTAILARAPIRWWIYALLPASYAFSLLLYVPPVMISILAIVVIVVF